METVVIDTYRGYEIIMVVTCGEIQGYFGNSITDATKYYTPSATTMTEIKALIDKSWEIRNSYKRLEYKQRGKKR